jgi:translation initiation factor 2 subunit 2
MSDDELILGKRKKHAENKDVDIYEYEFLLKRIYERMEKKENKHISVEYPRLAHIGSKKTAITNWFNLLQSINRTTMHAIAYLNKELNTTCTLNKDNYLVIKGRYKQSNIDTVFKQYVEIYVRCSVCKSLRTNLYKDKIYQLVKLSCNVCTAERTVEFVN